MKLLAQHRGYRIKAFKIANNSCYEAYFNPATTWLVRQNIAQ